jgi:predicted SAM-dependent methyltransferase
LAKDFLRGAGVEIGALDKPMRVPGHVRVLRADRLPTEELRAHYGLPDAVPVDLVCDAQTLESVGSGTQDFVVANHVFEHMENPLLALENWVRVLKPGGVVFMAIPDKRFTFDSDREVTQLSHLLDEWDHPEKVAANRNAHYEEWIRDVEHQEGDVHARLEFLLAIDYSIHFHCWTAHGLIELFSTAAASIAYEIECYKFNQPECIFVLKKRNS